MSIVKVANDLVTFKFGERFITLSEQDIGEVFDYRLTESRKRDAERQLRFYAFGTEEPDGDALEWFRHKYDLSFPEACKECIDSIVSFYADNFDCNVDENSQWQTAVKKVLDDHKKYQI